LEKPFWQLSNESQQPVHVPSEQVLVGLTQAWFLQMKLLSVQSWQSALF
jgi:hypothetical protein